MASSGKGSRRKGAEGEREGLAALTVLFAKHGITAKTRRTAPLQASCVRDALPDGVPTADGVCDVLPDDHLEIKRDERLGVDAMCRQAEADAPKGKRPVVVWRRNRQPWRVAMLLADYVGLQCRLQDAEAELLAARDALATARWAADTLGEDH